MPGESLLAKPISELLGDESWQGNIPDADRTTWFNAVCNAMVDLAYKGTDANFAGRCALSALKAINQEYVTHRSDQRV